MRYFLKHALYEPLIADLPASKLNMVVVIPCFNETELLKTLNSLEEVEKPDRPIEIIVVINHGANASVEIKECNKKAFEEVLEWKSVGRKYAYHFLFMEDLPPKHAGVGLARKIGMDEATRRLVSVENENGIIICLDADCLIEVNYFRAIESHFKASPECPAVSIDFAHRLDEFEPKQKIAIEKYERYLRDIISQQRAAGYPYAFHTIGSAMAVRSSDYMKQGGMNRRKAGEDFYFIHKFTSNPHFAEIKTTRVLPSARISDRVPFGTGRAIGDCLEQKKDITFYSPQTFRDLGALIQGVPAIYGMDDSQLGEWKSGLSEMLRQFLEKYDFDYNWKEMLANSSSEATFRKRFFQWLNPFLVMKMMNFARVFYPDKKDVKDV